MAAHKTACPIEDTVGPRFERLALQVVSNIPDESFNGCLPPLHILVNCLQAEDIELFPVRIADTEPRRGLLSPDRRRCGFLLLDDMFHLARSLVGEIVRKLSSQ